MRILSNVLVSKAVCHDLPDGFTILSLTIPELIDMAKTVVSRGVDNDPAVAYAVLQLLFRLSVYAPFSHDCVMILKTQWLELKEALGEQSDEKQTSTKPPLRAPTSLSFSKNSTPVSAVGSARSFWKSFSKSASANSLSSDSPVVEGVARSCSGSPQWLGSKSSSFKSLLSADDKDAPQQSMDMFVGKSVSFESSNNSPSNGIILHSVKGVESSEDAAEPDDACIRNVPSIESEFTVEPQI